LHRPKEWLVDHLAQTSTAGASRGNSAADQANVLLSFLSRLEPTAARKLEAVPPDLIRGAQIYASRGCSGCHQVNSEGGIIGPSLNGVGNRRSKEWIKAHFISPKSLSPGSLMPPYRFEKNEEEVLIEYLLALPD
jgi:cbb3-type cytochrome oxidase cytochrome c subunit